MAIDFPNSPTTNQTFTVGTRTWIWDGTTWELVATSSDPIQKTIVDAKGDLIAGTNSDAVARLAVGTNGQVLTADSAASTGMKWAAGGKVVQVVSATYATAVTVTSGTLTDTGLTATITPTSSSNTILVLVSQGLYIAKTSTSGVYGGGRLLRGATAILDMGSSDLIAAYGVAVTGSAQLGQIHRSNYMIVDNPATTSATTYKTQIRADGTETVIANSGNKTSSIILMEIAA